MLSDTPWAASPSLRTRRTLSATFDLARDHARPATTLGPRPGGGLVGLDPAGAGFTGTVLALTVLWSPGWSDADLESLASGVADGRLLFVEPTAGLGWRRGVQRALAPVLRRRLGHDFERDVPADLRRAGFLVTGIDRFHADRAGVLSYVYGEAVRRTR